MNELVVGALNVSEVWELLNPQALVYLVTMVGIFVVGKWVYDRLTPYDLNEQLVNTDNRAIAVSFTGYLLGLGIILEGVVSQESTSNTGSAIRDLLLDVAGGIHECVTKGRIYEEPVFRAEPAVEVSRCFRSRPPDAHAEPDLTLHGREKPRSAIVT